MAHDTESVTSGAVEISSVAAGRENVVSLSKRFGERTLIIWSWQGGLGAIMKRKIYTTTNHSCSSQIES